MRHNKTFSRGVKSFVFIAIISSPLFAGDITPPGGPVLPTMKDLDTVEPRIPIGPNTTPGDPMAVYIINQPGSYYLTENLVGEPLKHGIQISTSQVTIDLNGYTIRGVIDSLDGINLFFNSTQDITVRNGFVRSWGGNGVNILGTSGQGGLVENVVSSLNFGMGIRAPIAGLVRNCVSNSNGGIGILASERSIVENCIARGNIVGISAQDFSTVRNCTATNATVAAFDVANRTYIENNNASSSPAGAGFRVLGVGNRVDGNFSFSNGIGFDVNNIVSINNFLTRNVATANGTNYDFQGGNFGYVIQPPGSAAFTGNTGGTPFGTMDPWANIAF